MNDVTRVTDVTNVADVVSVTSGADVTGVTRVTEVTSEARVTDGTGGAGGVSPVSPGSAPRGKSPQRPIRIPDDVWYPAVARSKDDGRPIGHIVAALLARYAAGELDA